MWWVGFWNALYVKIKEGELLTNKKREPQVKRHTIFLVLLFSFFACKVFDTQERGGGNDLFWDSCLITPQLKANGAIPGKKEKSYNLRDPF